jgi:Holliday junction DNA helicase RuvB
MAERFAESSFTKRDKIFETTLRPGSLTDFIGQESVRERLDVFIQAAKGRGEPLGHALFSGPPGLGKTTLAHILSTEMGKNLVVTSGPAIEKPGDLAGVLTSLKEGDVLFIDEIHRLHPIVEEYLYPAMEDFKLDLMIDTGPSSRSVQVKLNRFTLAAATTRIGLISSPLRSRFQLNMKLDYYPPHNLQEVIKRSALLLNFLIDDEGSLEIAKRSRGTPRIANNLLKWVRDFSQVKGHKTATFDVVEKALGMLQIDKKGLDETDKRILEMMIDHHKGGPVGLSTIAASIGEEPDTIEEVHEPYLIMQGFLKRTPRGREVTELAYKHLEWS